MYLFFFIFFIMSLVFHSIDLATGSGTTSSTFAQIVIGKFNMTISPTVSIYITYITALTGAVLSLRLHLKKVKSVSK